MPLRNSRGQFISQGKGATVRFQPDPAALAAYMRQPGGPVVNDLIRRADMLISLAKRQVGRGSSPSTGSITGASGRSSQPHLADTIVKRVILNGPHGPIVCVGSDAAPKALIVHQGSRPHTIVPRTASVLRFIGSGGTEVYAMSVNHPGTRANRYLTDNLPRVMK